MTTNPFIAKAKRNEGQRNLLAWHLTHLTALRQRFIDEPTGGPGLERVEMKIKECERGLTV